jgi:uncharacterized protein YegP (UPF0339 family)
MTDAPENPVVRVSVYKDAAGEWRWRGIAGNNEVVATSGEGYTEHGHAVEMAERIFPDVGINVEDPPQPPDPVEPRPA